MPARKITFNGVPNSFEWQVGNTTRFIKFEDITEIDSTSSANEFYVFIGETSHIVPMNEYERFIDEFGRCVDNYEKL